jgi:hypothetical protein
LDEYTWEEVGDTFKKLMEDILWAKKKN